MLKMIYKLERSKAFWSLLAISLGFFLLRLPSLIEPNWYGDEGIYQIIGIALNNGRMLYSQILDNKPPLLYLTYALFQGDQFGVRIASLFIGLATTWLFFLLTQKLFHKLHVSTIATALFAFLFAIPLLEGNIANAENFMLFPIIGSGLIIYKFSTLEKAKKMHRFLFNPQFSLLGAAGFLLSIAFLFKIVAIFDFAAFFCFLVILALPEKNFFRLKTFTNLFSYVFTHLSSLIISFLLPIVLTVLYFLLHHAFADFINATLFGNIGYVNYGNTLFIAKGFMVLKLVLLFLVVSFVVWKRNTLSKPTIFILLWLAFSLFDAFFSQRPYTHYVLVLLPSICLLIAHIIAEQKVRIKQALSLLLIAVFVVIATQFKLYSLKKTVLYYQNAFLFITGARDTKTYQSFFDGKTPRDYTIASFLKTHTKPGDPVFIWGDSPQIYVLSQTLPINKYTVAYHMKHSKQDLQDTQHALDNVKPKYVILLFESSGVPFQLNSYSSKFTLSSAAIYERTF